MKGNPTNLSATKENSDPPQSTGKSNHVDTETTTAARTKKPPPQPKAGKSGKPGRPTPTTLIKETATPSQDQDDEDDEEDLQEFIKSMYRFIERLNKVFHEDSVHLNGKYCPEACCEQQITTWWYRAQDFADEQEGLPATSPLSAGTNKNVVINTATTRAEETRPQPQMDGPTRTSHPTRPAAGPPQGRPREELAAGSPRGRSQRRQQPGGTTRAAKPATRGATRKKPLHVRFSTTPQDNPTHTVHTEGPKPGTNHLGCGSACTWAGKQQEHQPTAENDKDQDYNSDNETPITDNSPPSPQRPRTSLSNPHDNATTALEHPDYSGAGPTQPSNLEKNDESRRTENRDPRPMANEVQVLVTNISTRGPGLDIGKRSRNPIREHDRSGKCSRGVKSKRMQNLYTKTN